MFGIGRNKHVRADISRIEQWIAAQLAARSNTGTALLVEELPIAQGLVALIADACADMELYAVDKPGPQGKPTGVTYAVLEQPDPDEDRADTIHKLVQSLFWGGGNGGNAWALRGPVDPATGAASAITVLNPSEVGWLPDPAHTLKVSAWTINGRRYERGELVHWKINDNPRHGPLGRSPVALAARALDMYGWAYRYLADFFASGSNPSSTMSSKLELAPERIQELAAEWVTARQQRRPAFLPNWLEYHVPQSSGEIESVIRVLEFGAAEFARLTNVPVSLVNAPTAGYSLTYTNIGDEFKRWLAVSLGTTWVRRLERGFSQLLPHGVWAKLDPSSLFPDELFGGDEPAADRPTPIDTPKEVPA